MKKKIHELEEKSIAPKPWTLSGEITAKDRPKESLLEVALDYDNPSKLPPVITEETTQTLEEIIKKRIFEESWDDPIRKVEIKTSFKPKIELNYEKSKKSLSEIHEDDYMKKKHKGLLKQMY